MEIRKAGPQDLEALLPLVWGYRRFYKQDSDPQAERRFMQEHLQNGTSVVYVATQDAALVGFMQLFPTYSTVHLGKALILEDLFVAPSARRSGAATMLLNAAIEYAREIHATGMFLETAIDNHTAQAVYEKAGWAREGHFYKYNAPLRA